MPNQHLLTCKSHYALCTSHFALCSFEIETLSKPSPKSPLEKSRGAKSNVAVILIVLFSPKTNTVLIPGQ